MAVIDMLLGQEKVNRQPPHSRGSDLHVCSTPSTPLPHSPQTVRSRSKYPI